MVDPPPLIDQDDLVADLLGLSAADFDDVSSDMSEDEEDDELTIFLSLFREKELTHLINRENAVGKAFTARPMSLVQLQQLAVMLPSDDPLMNQLVDKGHMARAIKQHGGSIKGPLAPQTFVFPDEFDEIEKLCEVDNLNTSAYSEDLWIVKPASTECAVGIKVVHGLKSALRKILCHRKAVVDYVIQQYIPPLLLGGFKFDFRLYVLITSLNPPEAYMHQSGLARFCAHQYDASQLEDANAHLTNVKINKAMSQVPYVPIEQVWQRLRKEGVDVARAKRSVEAAISNALLCTHRQSWGLKSEEESCSPTYQLVGFDVMLDDKHQPYVLEANRHPCISNLELRRQIMYDVVALLNPRHLSALLDDWISGGGMLLQSQQWSTDLVPRSPGDVAASGFRRMQILPC
jgi:hypothetical protein